MQIFTSFNFTLPPLHRQPKYRSFSAAQGARAAGHVFSQNIVGYTKVDLTGIVGSMQQTGVQFTLVDVNEDPLDIHKIILEDAAPGATSIRWFNPVSRQYGIAFWADWDEDFEEVEPSWRDGDGVPIIKTFVPGEGYWIAINGAIGPNPALFTAGQVLFDPSIEYFSLPFTIGSMDQRINPLPIATDIHDIIMSNAAPGATSIRWFDSDTRQYYVAFWADWDEDFEEVEPSWRDGDGVLIDKTFVVGEAFWVAVNGVLDSSPEAKTEILFKNPLFEP